MVHILNGIHLEWLIKCNYTHFIHLFCHISQHPKHLLCTLTKDQNICKHIVARKKINNTSSQDPRPITQIATIYGLLLKIQIYQLNVDAVASASYFNAGLSWQLTSSVVSMNLARQAEVLLLRQRYVRAFITFSFARLRCNDSVRTWLSSPPSIDVHRSLRLLLALLSQQLTSTWD